MPYGLCIFDLDGTLTDPKPAITRAYQYALSEFGIHEELDSMVRMIGPPLRENFKQYYDFSDSDTEKAVALFRDYFVRTGMSGNSVYPGIPEMLQKLRDNGITLAVATSKVRVTSEEIVAHFGLDKYFALVSGDDMDGGLTKHGKRDIILAALDALDPGRRTPAVMIGDRKHDIEAARDCGIDSIAVTWGYGSRAELVSAGATRFADSIDELCALILG